MRILIFFHLCIIFLYGQRFTVASYNVQNLFDLKIDGTEYDQYNPLKNKLWNNRTLEIKLNNIAKVINDIDAHIIALQEIESLKALNNLQKLLPKYRYKIFIKNKNSAVGVALLSKFKIKRVSKIDIISKQSYTRPILEVFFKIENKPFYIYVNHWRSKKFPESKRVDYAISLKEHLSNLHSNIDYLIVGDLNSNYNENQTIKFNKSLNDTYGITGINDILNSKKNHTNLWYELSYFQRFSYRFKGENNTPDHIILSNNLFDKKGISYIDNSFKVFKPTYIYKNKKIQRWKFRDIKKIESIKGYSDHLPIVASFSTKPFVQIKNSSSNQNSIEYLYTIQRLNNPILIDDVVVIYKYKNSALLKQKNGRSIWAYNCAKELKQGNVYKVNISKIDTFNGLKEIKSIDDIELISNNYNYKKEYIDGNSIDLFDERYQNEIITNISGVYRGRYLFFGNKKIKIYAKNKKLLPKNGQKVIIRSAHLSNFKAKVQLVIYKQSDIDVI